jgi:hypothetical protein
MKMRRKMTKRKKRKRKSWVREARQSSNDAG